jgi:prevent-host-death family protein
MYILMYTLVMSQRYSIAEARSRLPRIVDQAEAGVDVELTRRGRPVAVLVSCREFERLRGKRLHFRDAYKKFLKTHSLEEIGLDDDFAATARDRITGRKVLL